MSSLIAVVAAIAAALLFAVAAVADQLSTKRVRQRPALSPRIFADLVRQPLWLAAIAANAAGFALQVVALKFGSLAVVEPLLICDLIFAVLIRAWLSRMWLTRVFLAVAASAVGVAGFLVIAGPSAGHTHVGIAVLPELAIGLAVLAGGCLACPGAARTSGRWRWRWPAACVTAAPPSWSSWSPGSSAAGRPRCSPTGRSTR